MSAANLASIKMYDNFFNPLDEMEGLLEASGYSFNRDTPNRLSFLCDTKISCYSMVLEWHGEHEAMRISIIIQDTKKIDREKLDISIEKANTLAWHGFFVCDGVGNTIFKSLVPLKDQDDSLAFMTSLEDKIDRGLDEADRLYMSLNLDQSHKLSSLFDAQEEWHDENMILFYSDIKGNA